VAYLGYTSVGAEGSDAGPDKPGVTNIPIHTTYETRGAHAPVRVRTEPDGEALARLVEDIRHIRPDVDALILAFHSGVIRLPRVISDYQVAVAHAAIDAGADVVVGHAPHLPKGVEMYKGRPIFYSLGVFAMTKPNAAAPWKEPAWAHGAIRNHTDLDPAYPDMPYGVASTLSLLAKLVVGKGGVKRVSFLPMKIDTQYRPQALAAGDPRFSEVLEYMEWVSVDLPHRFEVQGDEVLVEAQD
jgi:poly-gamma-glutamate synthesis protein (capsule biosynthesis protein)